MDEALLKYLYDVLGAVTETLSYFDNRPKSFSMSLILTLCSEELWSVI